MVLKVVAYAEEFEPFPDEKKSLFNRAVIFLKEKLTTTDEMLSFLDSASSEHRDLAVRLLKEVKKLPCDQCHCNPCQHGVGIRGADQIKPGQLVRTSSTFLHENRSIVYEGWVCQVLPVNYPLKQVELNFLNPLSPSDKAVTFERLLRDFWETFERLLRSFWETFETLLRDFWVTFETAI